MSLSSVPGIGFLRARRGRSLALLLLVLATVTLAYREHTPLAGFHNLLFDGYQRLLPRDRTNLPAVVVAIDEKSLARFGQWPWPRTTMAQLLQRIQAGHPHAVGLDILYSEADRTSPAALTRQYPSLPPGTLKALPDPDQALALQLRQGVNILAVAASPVLADGMRTHLKGVPVLSPDGKAPETIPVFAGGMASLPLLEQAAAGQGIINAQPDPVSTDRERGVLRRLPLYAQVGDAPMAALTVEMVRQALGLPAVTVSPTQAGELRVSVGDYGLPATPGGELLLHFGHFREDRYLSAADVLSGVIPPGDFTGRFVLIGLTGVGLVDRVVTPLGEKIPGVDIHAQAIESLLAGTALRRPTALAWLEMLALVAGGLFLIAAVPTLRPVYAAAAGGAIGVALFAAGYGAFALGGWLFDAASVFALLNPLFVVLLGNTLVAADQQRRAAERDLQTSREAAAKAAGELEAARRIQMGLLPDPEQVFAGDGRLQVAALLEPARAVGGDFYDCFPLDDRRVCLAIGDVSGKGVPASLFMAVSKTLTGALARRNADLGQAIQEVEIELNRENPEFLFVTAFVAVLDLESGEVECVCAGHDAPFIVRPGHLSRLEVGQAGGPPLCALPAFPHRSVKAHLSPGDCLCLFTDGVSEATDGKGLFGQERLAACLTQQEEAHPRRIVDTIKAQVRRFEAGHPPADDLTLLVVGWVGPSPLNAP